jgi:protein TonB
MLTAERFFAPLMAAFLITFGLFWLMQSLVIIEEIELNPSPVTLVVPFVSVRQAPRPIETRTKRPKIPEQIEAPKITLAPSDPTNSRTHSFPVDPVDPIGPGNLSKEQWGPTSSNGAAVPLLRVAPKYPDRALSLGIEGRVLVEFTITRSGAVVDPRVVAAEPTGVFDEAALIAVQKWRYQPRVVDGRVVEQRGQRISIPFRRDSDSL